MKEWPALFSAEMILALVAGKKTQTRRFGGFWAKVEPGDRLWTRETWGYRGSGWNNLRPDEEEYDIAYRADGTRRRFVMGSHISAGGRPPGLPKCPTQKPGQTTADFYDVTLTAYWRQWRPSIFQPRWATRELLEVVSNREEPLQDITEADAAAEGVAPAPFCKTGRPAGMEHVEAFEGLWDSINDGLASWAANPRVRRIEFQRLKTP